MKRMISAVTLFFVSIVTPSLFLTACTTTINQPPAPLQQQTRVEQFQLDGNVSRIHIFNSGDNAIEIYINGVKVGLLGNAKEYMAIDLNPGTYDLKYEFKSPPMGPFIPVTLPFSVAKNQLLFLRSTWGVGSSSGSVVGGTVLPERSIPCYFEPVPNLKDHLYEYKLILLNQDMKKLLSK